MDHLKDGIGDYYRQVLVPKRTLERDATGNWQARWIDNGKADHYAHAEVYCLLAANVPQGAPFLPIIGVGGREPGLLSSWTGACDY